ncbi:RNA-binding protein 34 [Dunckerocampus dactyliophorus]|uniref:RNA-binding protein 34 n=1 Tax=Dunckerocampus dactyliophorus TaxID=161453 RepID=UPI002404D6E2|nr:RNA-binding protein 34 [Dunckerocampus dactyliophorus]
MKKRLHHSMETSPRHAPADYEVGQVSGSLFQKKSAASGSLSALFSSAAPTASVLFKPAPQLSHKNIQQLESQEVQGQAHPKEKKSPKKKSAAEQKLENRESSLQNADETEKKPKKRKRKVWEADAVKDVEHWVMKRQRLRAHKQEEAAKADRTVFVGNLPVNCTKKMLHSLFRDNGSIQSIRFRSMVREDPSMSRRVAAIKRQAHPLKQSINAYVVFEDSDGVSKALERNGVEIEKDFFIRVDRVTVNSSHDHKRSVFVGNLPFDVKELALRRHFEECGGVEAVRLVRDHNSGLGKGFGYILFESSDSVQLALKLDGSKLEGRSIRVKRSVKKEKSNTRGAAGKMPAQRKFLVKKSGPNHNFKGEMADPKKKPKKKPGKNKGKPKKSVHI